MYTRKPVVGLESINDLVDRYIVGIFRQRVTTVFSFPAGNYTCNFQFTKNCFEELAGKVPFANYKASRQCPSVRPWRAR
ncbi:MAG: hypothetical protein WDO15_01855 [Bacteroidota bacterium]